MWIMDKDKCIELIIKEKINDLKSKSMKRVIKYGLNKLVFIDDEFHLLPLKL